MKKLLMLTLVLLMVLGMAGVVMAEEPVVTAEEYEDDCLAAPAVAGLLLEEAGVDNRYGTGRDGGNYIRDVANHMGPGTDFNGVSKCDQFRYEYEIARFLKLEKDAEIELPENILLSAVFAGEGSVFGYNVGDTMTFTFLGDIQRTENIFVYFESAQEYREEWGKADYLVSENKLTIILTEEWNNPRPEIGDYVTGFSGITDLEGNAVVVPADGVEVTQQ